MDLREATPADENAIRRVHRESILGLGPRGYDDEQVQAWASGCDSADYVEAITADPIYYLVAEREDRVVGFGSLNYDVSQDEYETPIDAEVTAVYVHPAAAGAGIGTTLYESLEADARKNACSVLGLWASLNAVPFYERHGYQRVRSIDHEFSSDLDTGVTGEVVEMYKDL